MGLNLVIDIKAESSVFPFTIKLSSNFIEIIEKMGTQKEKETINLILDTGEFGVYKEYKNCNVRESLEILLALFERLENSKKLINYYFHYGEYTPKKQGTTMCPALIGKKPVVLIGGLGRCDITKIQIDNLTHQIVEEKIADISDKKKITTDDQVIEIIRKKSRSLPEIKKLKEVYKHLNNLDKDTIVKILIG